MRPDSLRLHLCLNVFPFFFTQTLLSRSSIIYIILQYILKKNTIELLTIKLRILLVRTHKSGYTRGCRSTALDLCGSAEWTIVKIRQRRTSLANTFGSTEQRKHKSVVVDEERERAHLRSRENHQSYP